MNATQVSRIALAIVMLAIATRIIMLMSSKSFFGWEVATYYVIFFWAISASRSRMFRSRCFEHSRLVPFIFIFGYGASIALIALMIEWPSSGSNSLFWSLIFFSALGIGYVVLAMKFIFGHFLRRKQES